eukprot:1550536-Pyramimonas_sp.AAC.1
MQLPSSYVSLAAVSCTPLLHAKSHSAGCRSPPTAGRHCDFGRTAVSSEVRVTVTGCLATVMPRPRFRRTFPFPPVPTRPSAAASPNSSVVAFVGCALSGPAFSADGPFSTTSSRFPGLVPVVCLG